MADRRLSLDHITVTDTSPLSLEIPQQNAINNQSTPLQRAQNAVKATRALVGAM